MKLTINEKIMETLLKSYDWYIRAVNTDRESYICGTIDATGQAILDIGEIFSEAGEDPYKFDAYKRVMEFQSVERYVLEYPNSLSKLQL